MDLICVNGTFLPAGQPCFTSRNRSFLYGDGVFETMKVFMGKILLEAYHYDRLLLGLKMLGIGEAPDPALLTQEALELCVQNNCLPSARIRLACYRNDRNRAEYVIEAFPLSPEVNQWNAQGLVIDLYPYARKNADAFSNLKTANFLPYVLAEQFARERGLDDALVINAFDLLCDSSKANLFLIRNNEVYTPGLHQGCVSGVMRRFLLDALKDRGYRVHQQEITEQQLRGADEVFLTNSIYDLRWVKTYRDCDFVHERSLILYTELISTFYA